MLVCEFDIIGTSPISFSKAITEPKRTGETHDAYEERTWRLRAHADQTGEAFIPPQALKNCLESVARYLSESVPGKGKATYTKHFASGIMVTEPMPLGVKAEHIPPERLHVPSDGKKGGGSRVWKTFPTLPTWKTRAQVYVLDPVLLDKPEMIGRYADHAGKFIGFGRFRPQNGGFYGRFKIANFKTRKVTD